MTPFCTSIVKILDNIFRGTHQRKKHTSPLGVFKHILMPKIEPLLTLTHISWDMV